MNGAKSKPKLGSEADVIDLTDDVTPPVWRLQGREGTRRKGVPETINLLDDEDDGEPIPVLARKQTAGQNEPSVHISQSTGFLPDSSRPGPSRNNAFTTFRTSTFSQIPASATTTRQTAVQPPTASMGNPFSADSGSQASGVQSNRAWHAEQMRAMRAMGNRHTTAAAPTESQVQRLADVFRNAEALRPRPSESIDPLAAGIQPKEKTTNPEPTQGPPVLRDDAANFAHKIASSGHDLLQEQVSKPKKRIGYEFAQLPNPFRAATESADLTKAADVSMFFGANARRAASERASSRPPVSSALRCGACIDFHLACDGQQPCSRCVEFSASCEYGQNSSHPHAADEGSRSKPPQILVSKGPGLLSELSHTRETLQNEMHNSPELPQILVPKESELLPEPLRTPETLQIETHNTPDQAPPEESQNSLQHESEPIPAASIPNLAGEPDRIATTAPPKQIALELEVIDAALEQHCNSVDAHRQDVVQGLLREARLQMVPTALGSLSTRQPDPFSQLLSKPSQNAMMAVIKTDVFVEIKTRCFGATAARGSNLRTETVAMQAFCTTSATIPRYKSVGLTRQNLIARNVKTYKYVPYFQEHENSSANQLRRDEEINEQYKKTKDALIQQRWCREIANTWRPYLEGLLNEYGISPLALHQYMTATQDHLSELDLSDEIITACKEGQRCIDCDNARFAQKPLPTISNAEVDTRSLGLAGAFSHYMRVRAGSSLFHIMSESKGIRDLYRSHRAESSTSSATKLDSLCLVCYRHFCISHGPFLEDDDLTKVPQEDGIEMSNEEDFEGSTGDGIADDGGGRIDDCEAVNNKRLYVSLPERKRNLQSHICGIFCADQDTFIHDLFGRHEDGKLGGSSYCETIISDDALLSDEESCSDSCFWNVNKRSPALSMVRDVNHDSLKELTQHQSDRLKSMGLMLSNHQRASCLIAMSVEKVSCLDTFYHLIQSTNATPHPCETEEPQRPLLRPARSHTGRSYPPMTSVIHERPPFVPCSHEGPCKPGKNCSCMETKVACEWYCGCDESCSRRFRGCDCRAEDRRACFEDARCECWQYSRECDPHLCGDCGVTEVLEPSNRYLEESRKGRCRNNRLQLNLPRRTLKGPSEVHGWGLFAGENLKKGDFIGEYKGETVSQAESDRRGLVYHNIELEYLFLINRHQQIDGSNVGNKMRLMNNSQLKEHINVTPMKLLCNGIPRVMLCAARDIQAGEEMFYKYGYEDEVTMKFWEKGEKPKDGTSNKTILSPMDKKKHSPKLGRATETSDMRSSPLRSVVASSKRASEDGSSPLIVKKRKRAPTTEKNSSTTSNVPRDETREHITASSSDVKVISDTNGTGSEYDATEDSMKDSDAQDQSDAEISDSERSGGDLEVEELEEIRRVNRHRGPATGTRRNGEPDLRFGGESQRKAGETLRRRKAMKDMSNAS